MSCDNTTDGSFRQRVYQVVAAIPAGRVTTYGTVAALAGSPRAARQVGGILSRLPEGSQLPWHRVINRQGLISLTGDDAQRQHALLRAEGIASGLTAPIDLQQLGWRGD